jgi:hypothetical protein
MYKSKADETRDVPFLKNDMNDSPPTTGKRLDATDAPGKADSEMLKDDECTGEAKDNVEFDK